MTSSRTVSRLSRILALIPYVLERDSVEMGEVLERFGYTPEQLSRDLDTVFVCGLPGYGPGELMEAYLDEDVVVIDAADYFTRAPRLTPTEALGLLAAGMTVIDMGEGNPALQSAVGKLSKVLVPGAGPVLSVDVLDENEHVRRLKEAAAASRVVRIVYRSVGREQTTERDVEPWIVFHTLGTWYVVGHCRLVGGERTFRVDRIKESEMLDEVFRRPSRVPVPGIGYTPSEGDISCVIDLDAEAMWVPEYYPVEILERRQSGARVRFWAPDPEVAARLLLRLGSAGRLVEGPEVAGRLRELGSSLLALYS
ncbi:MAG: WYL domain-containing protein [Actinobacteria bacterium]|nr:WYL domain-containing protein [Actinomycetota bacterium]MCI0543583.1 WYL domain-containing protein [Actinomycetota bacterium]MCI0677934.1 WYL domain-containing protein [Actinomycetota bacterium]